MSASTSSENQTVPTIREIAKAAGVSRSTVSAALNNRPNISAATKKTIHQLAKKMGYRQDAQVDQLMSYLSKRKGRRQLIPLAWINAQKQRDAFNRYPWWIPMYEGAKQRANQIGFSLNEFWLHDPAIKPKRLRSILHAQGIRGLVLTPPYHLAIWDELDLSGFTVVQASVDPGTGQYHAASLDRSHAMNLLWKKLRERGYQRIGLYLIHAPDQRVDAAYGAQYLWLSGSYEGKTEIPILHHDSQLNWEEKKAVTFDWLIHHQVDAVITNNGALLKACEALNIGVPKDLGIGIIHIPPDMEHFSGIRPRSREMGATAIDILAAQFHCGAFDLGDFPVSIHLKGSWNEGKTTRQMAPPNSL